VLQRVINYTGGTRTRNVDLTDVILRFTDYGTTFVRLNAERFPGGSAANALDAPTLVTENTDEGVELSVASEPTQQLSYEMVLPKAGPWEARTTLDNAAVRVGNMRNRAVDYSRHGKADDQIRLQFTGLPNDTTFAGLVETHEDHHVQDLAAIRDAILVPWDRLIRRSITEDRKVHGATQEEAMHNFYKDIGGTPAQKGKEFVDELRRRGGVFHQTGQGSAPTVEEVLYSSVNKHMIVKMRHPMG